MDHDRIVSVNIEDADLQERPVRCRSDQHREPLIHDDTAYRVAHGVKHVQLDDPVFARRVADPHSDNVSCHRRPGNKCCLLRAASDRRLRPSVSSPAPTARACARNRRSVGTVEALQPLDLPGALAAFHDRHPVDPTLATPILRPGGCGGIKSIGRRPGERSAYGRRHQAARQ